jgi:hypothetical protein
MNFKITKTGYLIITLFILVIVAIILTIWRFAHPPAPAALAIYQVIPINETKNYDTTWPISVYFNRALTEEEQHSVSLKINPAVDGSIEWSVDNKSVSLTPKSQMQTNQLYTAIVSYLTKTQTWRFTTSATAGLSSQQIIKNQSAADQDYALASQKILDKYPWIDSLPLDTKDYFVYFDEDKVQMIGRLYPQSNSPISQENQIDAIKIEAQKKLDDLKVDTAKYPVQWQVIPR